MREFFGSFVNSILNSNYPIVGLSILSFAESFFFPIPPDVVYIPLAILNPKNAFFYAFITTFFSVLGGIFGYYLGKIGGRPLIKKIVSEEKLYQVKLFYARYDVLAVIIGGFTPIPYKIFSISAGIFDISLKKFILASIIGRGGRFFLVCALIFFFGSRIKYFLENYFEIFTIIFTLLLIGGFVFVNKFFTNKSKENNG
jgi:membrane protein YqaA with SNARE-associated domain